MDSISVAFDLIAELAIELGAHPLNKHDGCWEYSVESWRLAVNGHREPKKSSSGIEVQPFHCYLEFNGWPAGMLNPREGTIAAGSIANEDALIEALERRLAGLRTQH